MAVVNTWHCLNFTYTKQQGKFIFLLLDCKDNEKMWLNVFLCEKNFPCFFSFF